MADPNFEWWSSSAGQTEYFDNLDQQYTYFCYGENDYEACQKRAEFLRRSVANTNSRRTSSSTAAKNSERPDVAFRRRKMCFLNRGSRRKKSKNPICRNIGNTICRRVGLQTIRGRSSS